MADDIMIKVGMEVQEALNNLGNLKDAITTAQSTMSEKLGSSVETAGTKLTNLGGKVTGAGEKIQKWLGSDSVQAFKRAGDACKDFATDCVQSALKSEQAWTRFGSLVDSNGGNWDAQKSEIKGWAREFSTSVGRTVGDTREAMTSFLQMGLTVDQSKNAMNAAAGVAARAGISEAEAAGVVTSALLGKGRQLEKLTGLRLEDYKNAEGQIDQERLLNDIYNQNKGAIDDYANSTEGQVNKMTNAWNSFKTSIGQALLPIVKIIADIATQVAQWFADLPGPVKTFIAALLAIGAAVSVVIGVLAFIAPVLTTIGTIITGIGAAGSVVGFVTTAFSGLSAGLGVLAGVIAPLIVPILAVVAALTALYFIGIQMGWWSDLSGMISVFMDVLGQAAGVVMNFVGWIGKLFTDFPAAAEEFNQFTDTVRDAIMNGLGQLGDMAWQALQGVWDAIVNASTELGNALSQMFWDAVNGLGSTIQSTLGNIGGLITDALSNLGASVVPGGGLTEGILAIVAPLPTLLYGKLLELGPYVLPAITSFIDTVVQGFMSLGGQILDAFTSIPALLTQAFMNIGITIQQWLTQASMIAGMLVQMLVTNITTRFWNIVNGVRNVFMWVVMTIQQRLSQAWALGGMLANMVRHAIVTKFNQIIARVRQIFQTIVSTIRQRLANAVTTAKNKAQEILQGIKDKVAQIPDKVKEEFDKIKDRISTALDNAKNVAVQKISDLVAAVKGALGIASPGFIQRMMAYEFESIPGIIMDNGARAISSAATVAEGIVGAWDDNMNPLGVSTSPISQFDMLGPNALMNTMATNYSMGIASSMARKMPGNSNVDNSTEHTTIINVDKIELDCNNLTQQQSRKILYDALDGLYTGGV